MSENSKQEFRVEFIGANFTDEQAEAIENAIKAAVSSKLSEMNFSDKFKERELLQTEAARPGGVLRGFFLVQDDFR